MRRCDLLRSLAAAAAVAAVFVSSSFASSDATSSSSAAIAAAVAAFVVEVPRRESRLSKRSPVGGGRRRRSVVAARFFPVPTASSARFAATASGGGGGGGGVRSHPRRGGRRGASKTSSTEEEASTASTVTTATDGTAVVPPSNAPSPPQGGGTEERRRRRGQQLGSFEPLDLSVGVGGRGGLSPGGSSRNVLLIDLCSGSDENPMPFRAIWDLQKVSLNGHLERLGGESAPSQFLPEDDGRCSTMDYGDEGGRGCDTVMMLQHEPVYTLGTASDPSFIKTSDGGAPDVDVVRIERGGEVTYHGPGQLVVYPILDLRGYKQDVHWYVRALEEAILKALQSAGVEQATREADVTGVFVSSKKIASIGIKIRRWVTMHGLAVNVDRRSLHNFDGIVPCGLIGREVTCINDHLEEPMTVEEFANVHMKEALEDVFRVRLV